MLRLTLILLGAFTLAACSSFSDKHQSDKHQASKNTGKYYQDDGPPIEPLSVTTQDAIPVQEQLSRRGNSPYTVMGKRYFPTLDISTLVEYGEASWYGKKYHGRTTSSGEIYDMYLMTAAHTTLPLPSYVRVTNTKNQLSVVVKVNDRGPFLKGRIVDLSYAAARKIGLDKMGVAPVKLELISTPIH